MSCWWDAYEEWPPKLIRADKKATITRVTVLYNCKEKYLRIHNKSNLEVDGLQQQKTTLSSTTSQEQKAEAAVGTGSP